MINHLSISDQKLALETIYKSTNIPLMLHLQHPLLPKQVSSLLPPTITNKLSFSKMSAFHNNIARIKQQKQNMRFLPYYLNIVVQSKLRQTAI